MYKRSRQVNNMDYKLHMPLYHLEAEHDPDPEKAFPFFKLPTELRYMIYDYALATPADNLRIHKLEDGEQKTSITKPPRLLQVNQQIRMEASRVFYRGKQVIGTAQALKGWLDANPFKLSWLKSMFVQGCPGCEHGCSVMLSREAGGCISWRISGGLTTEPDEYPGRCFGGEAVRGQLEKCVDQLKTQLAASPALARAQQEELAAGALKRCLEFLVSLENVTTQEDGVEEQSRSGSSRGVKRRRIG